MNNVISQNFSKEYKKDAPIKRHSENDVGPNINVIVDDLNFSGSQCSPSMPSVEIEDSEIIKSNLDIMDLTSLKYLERTSELVASNINKGLELERKFTNDVKHTRKPNEVVNHLNPSNKLQGNPLDITLSNMVQSTQTLKENEMTYSSESMSGACSSMAPRYESVQRNIKLSPIASLDRTDNHGLTSTENAPDMRQVEERLKTFTNWPLKFIKPDTLANNGFYYLGRGDEVRCAFCKVEIMRWEEGDDPAADHRRWAPQCPFLRQSRSGSGSPSINATSDGHDECGTRASVSTVRMPGPANPNYATYISRLNSFKDWPMSLRQKPKDLADAGFFYTGQGDKTKCFYCDGGLKDWEDDDIPWEQHARWFDRCAFVQLAKGRDYVQRVMTEASTIKSTTKEKVNLTKTKEEKETKPADKDSDKVTTIDDEKLCKICYERERNVCFVPCGHVVSCAMCAFSTTKCPMCRRTFQSAVRLYYS